MIYYIAKRRESLNFCPAVGTCICTASASFSTKAARFIIKRYWKVYAWEWLCLKQVCKKVGKMRGTMHDFAENTVQSICLDMCGIVIFTIDNRACHCSQCTVQRNGPVMDQQRDSYRRHRVGAGGLANIWTPWRLDQYFIFRISEPVHLSDNTMHRNAITRTPSEIFNEARTWRNPWAAEMDKAHLQALEVVFHGLL